MNLPAKAILTLSLFVAGHADICPAQILKADIRANAAGAPDSEAAGTNLLRLHFRGAPLESVLEYFAQAAGFTIALEAKLHGTVDVWSDQPLSTSEGLNLLNSVLIRNDLAAIRNGQILTIINRDEAKVREIPVRLGADPQYIPRTDEIVTQIIPARNIEAGQLAKSLAPLVAPRTTMTANESANALVITDTQTNIRHLAELIKAMEGGAAGVTIIKVFRLQNADAQEMADLISNMFPSSDRSGENQSPAQFEPPPFGPGGPPPGLPDMPAANGNGDGANQRSRKATPVTAIADPRTSSVIVSAADNMMNQVAGIVTSLDASPARKKRLAVYELKNASAQQVSTVLQTIFQKSANSNNRSASTQSDALETRMTQQAQQSSSAASATIGGNSGGQGGPGGGGPQ